MQHIGTIAKEFILLHHHVLSETKKGSTSGLKSRLSTDTGFHLAPKHLTMSRYVTLCHYYIPQVFLLFLLSVF